MLLVAQRPDARALAAAAGGAVRPSRWRRSTPTQAGALVGHLLGGAGGDGLAPGCATWSPRAPAATRCSSRRSCAAWPGRGLLVREGERWDCAAARARRWTCRRRCTACCCRASTGWPRRDRRLLQEAAVLGAAFDARCCSAVASDAGRDRRALRAARSTADLVRARAGAASALALHARAAARGGLPEPAAGAAHRAARARRPGARGTSRAATAAMASPTRAPGRPGGARPPLEPVSRQGRAARATCWLPATGRAPSTPTTTRSATTSARCARWPKLRRRAARRRDRAMVLDAASGWPTCSALQRPPRRSAGAVRARCRQATETRHEPVRRGARCCARPAGCTGRPATASAPAPASTPGWRGWASRATRSSARTCSRRWAGSPSAPATTPPRIALGRARARPRLPRRRPGTRAREARGACAPGLQHARRRAGAHWAGRRGGGADRAAASPRPRRTSCCRRPAAATPTSACCTLARPAAQHRDLPARARDRAQGRRPRLPVAAVRQPRGRLLRADQPLRGRGHRGGAAPPSTSTAGSACSTTWRCR